MGSVGEETEVLEDGAATAIERPTPRPRTGSTPALTANASASLGSHGKTTIVTSDQAMQHVEAHRVRGLMIGMTGISVVAAIVVMLLDGDPFAKQVHAGALAVSALVTGTYSIVFRDPAKFRPNLAMYLVLGTILVALTGYYYWGVFSAYAAVIPLTVYVIGAGATAKQAIIGTTLLVFAQAAIGVATVMSWIEPRGLVDPVRAGQTTQLVAVGLIQLLTIGGLLGGREARRMTLAVLEEHDKAIRALAQRDAQLAEAHAEARLAREGGAGGRFVNQVIGEFQLFDLLGKGAMGEVYAAERITDKAPCAVKMLAPHLLRTAAAHQRFQREAAIVSALDSPHVVKVLSVSPPDAPLPYLAMERLDGTELAQMIKERPVRPLPEVVELMNQVARGLDAAHAAGVIHRDLKPHNLLAIGPPTMRTWKILDFGASKWVDDEGSLTQDAVVGTPGYMAPEQALGQPVDARSDVYALGIIIYRLVTEVKREVEDVLSIALAKTPADRFASAGQLAAALAAAHRGVLSKELAERAAQIRAKAPWGAWLDRREARDRVGRRPATLGK
jgi:tRNA A-37 threonylcarbamoyl transferase component Bud32